MGQAHRRNYRSPGQLYRLTLHLSQLDHRSQEVYDCQVRSPLPGLWQPHKQRSLMLVRCDIPSPLARDNREGRSRDQKTAETKRHRRSFGVLRFQHGKNLVNVPNLKQHLHQSQPRISFNPNMRFFSVRKCFGHDLTNVNRCVFADMDQLLLRPM